MEAALREDSRVGQSVRAQLGAGGGGAKDGCFEAEEDRYVIRASGGEGVGPFREVRCKAGGGKSKIKDTRAPNA